MEASVGFLHLRMQALPLVNKTLLLLQQRNPSSYVAVFSLAVVPKLLEILESTALGQWAMIFQFCDKLNIVLGIVLFILMLPHLCSCHFPVM